MYIRSNTRFLYHFANIHVYTFEILIEEDWRTRFAHGNALIFSSYNSKPYVVVYKMIQEFYVRPTLIEGISKN